MSGTSDKDKHIGFPAPQSHRNGHRGLRTPSQQRTWSPARGDDPSIGHLAPLSARRRGLSATVDQASGSTLRRCLARWAETGLLAKVPALLAAMLRGNPDLILDSCSVRAKRGGDLTGPNPTDSGK